MSLKKRILVVRTAALGDVLIAAAVLPAIRKKFPESEIYFFTGYAEVLQGNPFVHKVISDENYIPDHSFDFIYNLDMTYERRPEAGILQTYADTVWVAVEDCELFLHCEPFNGLSDCYIVFHAGRTAWVGRNWHRKRFQNLADRLKMNGFDIVCVGGSNDHPLDCDLDLRGRTSIHQLATIVKNAALFVGIDSFPMHIAQAMHTPGVVFFGSVKPELRIIECRMSGVTAKGLNCLGCHHRKSVPSTITEVCENGTLACETGVSEEMMWKIIQEKLASKSASILPCGGGMMY